MMSQTAEKLLTFEEFASLNTEGRYELVDGRLEELVSAKLPHGLTGGRIFALLDAYLQERDPGGHWGVELDIPTLPYYGRRPDFAYWPAADAATMIGPDASILGVPTLVVEVLSPGDEGRDLITKRREYADVGILHYWILNPQRRTALTLVLRGDRYEVAGEFSLGDTLTSEFFPGLKVPLTRLFRY